MTTLNKDTDYVFIYKNVFNDAGSLIDFIESTELKDSNAIISKWQPWKSSSSDTHYGYEKHVFFQNQRLVNEFNIEEYMFFQLVKSGLSACIKNYCAFYNIEEPIVQDHFSIKKYSIGTDMGDHVDDHMNPDMPEPYLSCIFYINDNYDGGNLLFRLQDLNIVPEAGSVVIFPSSAPFFHNPRPVTEGVKYMIQIFLYKEKKNDVL